MKTQNAQRYVAIFTAVSLAFIQAVPVGFALPAVPNGQSVETSQPSIPVQAVTDTPAQVVPLAAQIPPNPLMNTGGITKILPPIQPINLMKLPLAVQAYVNILQIRAGAGYKVTGTIQKDGTYLITVEDSKVYVKAPTEGLHRMSFILDTKIQFQIDSLKASYYGVNGDIPVDAKLLFQAVGMCSQGEACTKQLITDTERLTRMTRVSVSSADSTGMIHYSLDNNYYQVYRDANNNVILKREIPPAVQKYIEALKQMVGVGFKVTAVLQRDGSYLIRVVDAKVYAKAPTAGLRQLSFSLSADGTMDLKSVQATYYGVKGDIVVDGYLLFEGVRLLYAGVKYTVDVIFGKILGDMSRLAVSSVESSGMIHFSLNNDYYRTYWNSKGNLAVLEKELPPAVQAYIDALKQQMGAGFKVAAVLRADGTYLVSVEDSKAYAQAPSAGLKIMTVILSAAGAPGVQSLQLTYYGASGDIKVDGTLLYAALENLYPPVQAIPCQPGTDCVTSPIVNWEVMKAMSQLNVTKVENLEINFVLGGKSYKAYRNADGRVMLDEIVALPPAVQAYVDQLKQKVGDGFKVVATRRDDGTYLISVSDSKMYTKAPEAGLQLLSFVTNQEGIVQDGSVQASYYEAQKVDGNLLFGAAVHLADPCYGQGELCTQLALTVQESSQRALALLTQIKVGSVEASGAIHLTFNGKNYKAYRDIEGNLRLEEESSLPPAVQQFVAGLQARLSHWGGGNDWYQTQASIRDSGEILITVLARGLNLLQMSFIVDINGLPQAGSFYGNYGGVGVVDENLLFEGMQYLNPAMDVIGILVQTIRLSVYKVEGKVLHVQQALESGISHWYQILRGADGKVVIKEEPSPAVQDYVLNLQKQLGDKFTITVFPTTDGFYGIEINDPNYPNTSSGKMFWMSLLLDGNGNLVPGKVWVRYSGISPVDGQFLFDALHQLPADDTQALVAMGKARVLSAGFGPFGPEMTFEVLGKSYKAYASQDGIKLVDISDLVKLGDELRKELGAGYAVGFFEDNFMGKGIEVQYVSTDPLLAGKLQHMRITFAPDGKLQVDAMYANQLVVDGRFLFDALHQLPADDTQALVAMGRLTVRSVENPGSVSEVIHFTLDQTDWKVYWDNQNPRHAKIEREIILPDGIVLNILEISRQEIMDLVSAQLNSPDRDAAIAAINSLPSTAAFYRTQVLKDGVLQNTQYECTPEKRDMAKANPQSMMFPGDVMPNPGLVQIFAAGSASPFFETKMFFGQAGFLLSVISRIDAPTLPPQVAALVRTSRLNGDRYADVYLDPQGNVTKVIYYKTLPDGTELKIEELNRDYILSTVVPQNVNIADQAEAIAAINAMPPTAVFYKTEVRKNGVLQVTQYECAPAKRNFNKNPQAMFLPGDAMPNPGRVQVYADAAGSTDPFFESKIFFGKNGAILSVNSIENTQATPPPVAALARTSRLNGDRYADVYLDPQGNVIKIVRYMTATLRVEKEVNTDPALRAQLAGGSSLFVPTDLVYHVTTWEGQLLVSESYEIMTASGNIKHSKNIDPVTGKVSWTETIRTGDPVLRGSLLGGMMSDQDVFEVRTFDTAFDHAGRMLLSHVAKIDIYGGGTLIRTKVYEVMNGVESMKVTWSEQMRILDAATSRTLLVGIVSNQDVFEVRIFDAAFDHAVRMLLSHVLKIDVYGDGNIIHTKAYEVINGVETGTFMWIQGVRKSPMELDFQGNPLGIALGANTTEFLGQPLYYVELSKDAFDVPGRVLSGIHYQVVAVDRSKMRIEYKDLKTGEVGFFEQVPAPLYDFDYGKFRSLSH